jgi:amino acid adenylation domain-containing protein
MTADVLVATEPFALTDLQQAYLVGATDLIELGGFRPHFYVEFDVVGLVAGRAGEVFDALVARHEHLRTVVTPDGRQRVLDVADVPPLRVPVTELSALVPDDRHAALAATRRRMLAGGIDPTRWPLFDVAVSVLRPRRARVHVGMSLLLLDAHSTWHVLTEARELFRDPSRSLPPVPMTFREWCAAMPSRTDGATYRDHWRYWTGRVDSLPDAPVLPLAGPLGALGPVRLTRRTCTLSAEQWRRLSANVVRRRIMPASALAHAFAETLGAWAGSPRFCLNVLHQSWRGRRPAWAGIVGQLGATLPLEVDLGGEADFWQRGQRLQSQLWRDLEHSDATAVQIMREVASRRGWTGRPALPYVFNGMLGAGPRERSAWRPTGVVAESGLRTPHVLVDNQVQDAPGGGVTCVWDIVDEAFPPGLPDAMFDAYRELLHSMAAPNPGPPSVGSVAHRDRVLAVNDTAAPLPAGRLEEGFLRQAARRPEAVALVTPARTMTYGEVEAASRSVAAWLRAQGVGRGDIVPVVMAKGWAQVVAVLGVLRAGAAYCPMDAGLPAERIRALVGQCAARAVLLTARHPVSLVESVPALEVDRPAASAGELPAVAGGEPDDLAYVIHTSGSTGQPKGVMVEHRAARNTIEDINDRVGLGPADRVFGISSLSFDLSVWDVFGALGVGAALVLPEATPQPDPVGWAAAAVRHGVTVWNSVPALAAMLAEVAEHRPELGRPPLRVTLLSGDWVPLALPDRMRRLWPGLRVVALGGATEAAIWSNSFEVGHVDPGWRSIPYGTPLRNQTMWVLDDRLAIRPPWATGQIHIGGVGLARGYLGDAERTAERFHIHPRTGERLYRTGDLGRYWPDGTIEFLGREDRQVKVLGFRVEPGEVEAALRECPGVAECVVTAQASPDGQRRLVALVVPAPGERVDEAGLRARLRHQLPHYMVPARTHVVERLPLTANGKVDAARALATLPAGTPATPADDHRAEPTALVARLAPLWSELLDAPADPDGDFFALGGNSLLALRLVHRVRDALGVDVPFGDIFEAPTPRRLAARLARGDTSAPAGLAVRLNRRGDGPVLFLFHPVGGSVGCYARLASAWPGPVHAFQSPALAGRPDPWSDLAAMAAGYREELVRLAPDGPLTLGGWSMGGVLAYEMGVQLARAGRRPCAFLIDSEVPRGRALGGEATHGRTDTGERASHVAFLTDLAAGRLAGEAARAVRSADPAQLGRVARDVAVAHGLLPPETDVTGYERLRDVHRRNLALLADYRPGRAGLPTLLFVASAVDRPDPTAGWRAVCGDLAVERFPLDHYGIVADGPLAAIAERVVRWSSGVHNGHEERAN